MARSTRKNQSILEIVTHFNDVSAAARLYFSSISPDFTTRFIGYDREKLEAELMMRLEEISLLSSLALLAAIEAVFRVDYLLRCQTRKRDDLSRAFRTLYRAKEARVSFEDEILDLWKEHTSAPALLGDIKGAFKLRHWLAHGRWWVLKIGRKYDFATVYTIADRAINTLPLYQA